ncbi:MAG: polysaccharide biosynthesis protein [Eubacteriales bacterium]|nr:polysaccharide biosynthesis protein [Eubacteriales bacterium]
MKLDLKNALLKGTIILTAAGIICRIIGFFFRIYITRLIGSEGMGIYQLITPLAGVVYAACIGGICTAVSRFTAENTKSVLWMITGLFLSVPMSVFCLIMFWEYSDFIAARILMNPDCSFAVKMLSLSFPFASLHSCIGAYFLGKQNVKIPAFSQLLEQIIRIGTVILTSLLFNKMGKSISVSIILLGNLIGDMASTIYNILCVFSMTKARLKKKRAFDKQLLICMGRITTYSLPLTLNRVLMQLLASGEAVLIPLQLMLYGMNQSEAVSIYGILSGMAIPFISFPAAMTNSLAVMLLPEISGAQAKQNNKKIASIIRHTVKLCLYLGLFFTMLFIVIGSKLSVIMFKNNTVGIFVSILSWICPFQYMAVTLGSILNGLGKTTSTCVVNISGILIRIAFLIILTPRLGITGYLYGLLCGQIVVCAAHFLQLNHMFNLFQRASTHV